MMKHISAFIAGLVLLSCTSGQLIKENITTKVDGLPLEVYIQEVVRTHDGISVTISVTNDSEGALFLDLVGSLLLAQGQTGVSIETGKTKVVPSQVPTEVRWRSSALSGVQDVFMYAAGKSAHVLRLKGKGDSGVRTLRYALPTDFQPTEIYFHKVFNGTVNGAYKEDVSFSVKL